MTQLPYLAWNVIGKEDFEHRSQEVFSSVADVLRNTLGPYGSTTIIETHNDYKVTKDGWNVLKAIDFNTVTEKNILMLLINIAQRVVRKVGDGSTSSVVSANYLLQKLTKFVQENNIRSKELLKLLEKVTAQIEEEILNVAWKIDREGDFHEIYNIAHISTNGDDEIASLIQQAYQATRSTAVHYAKSRSYKNELEIIEGFQSRIGYLDPTFVNTDNGTGEYSNMDVMIIDHTVENEYHLNFILEAQADAAKRGVGLLLIAPYFDTPIHESFASFCNREKAQLGKHYFVVARATMVNNHDKNAIRDLASLVGCTIVTENIINEYNKKRIDEEERKKMFNARLSGDVNELIETDPLKYIGRIGHVAIGAKQTLFQDFINKNEADYQACVLDAKNRLAKQEEVDEETAIINQDGYFLEERVKRLECKTAVIKAGGRTTLEKGANYDLLEDAVKASASAFKYGYTIGGNLSITTAISRIKRSAFLGFTTLSDTETKVLEAIFDAFIDVLADVLINAQITDIPVLDIHSNAFEGKGCYNIVTQSYDNKVINPVMTDIEILKGAISIVSLMISSNQYISLSPTISVR